MLQEHQKGGLKGKGGEKKFQRKQEPSLKGKDWFLLAEVVKEKTAKKKAPKTGGKQTARLRRRGKTTRHINLAKHLPKRETSRTKGKKEVPNEITHNKAKREPNEEKDEGRNFSRKRRNQWSD